jgi:hypothetical protein
VTKMVEALPAEFKGSLPTIRQIEDELGSAGTSSDDSAHGHVGRSVRKRRRIARELGDGKQPALGRSEVEG